MKLPKPSPHFVFTIGVLVITLFLMAISGCAGLSVNFDATVTYRSDVPLGTRSK